MKTTTDTTGLRHRLMARRAELAERRDRATRDASHRNAPVPQDFADQATARENDDALRGIAVAAEEDLRSVDAALRRLADGRYGTCERCGGAIEPARLAAKPEAIRCRACAVN